MVHHFIQSSLHLGAICERCNKTSSNSLEVKHQLKSYCCKHLNRHHRCFKRHHPCFVFAPLKTKVHIFEIQVQPPCHIGPQMHITDPMWRCCKIPVQEHFGTPKRVSHLTTECDSEPSVSFAHFDILTGSAKLKEAKRNSSGRKWHLFCLPRPFNDYQLRNFAEIIRKNYLYNRLQAEKTVDCIKIHQRESKVKSKLKTKILTSIFPFNIEHKMAKLTPTDFL